ncbi:MAG TPA: adenine deaminase [Pirellulales bacterium]|jgi:adenine deaminase
MTFSPTDRSFQISANIVDVHRRRVFPGTVVVHNARIAEIIPQIGATYTSYLAPGFIDAHVHVESSMLPPSEFSRLAVVHGTVATVSDPHEIANVLGMEGVAWMLAEGAEAAMKICFGAPSCVPATPFDRAGAVLGVAEIEALLGVPGIGYLSEMMNYPGVVSGQADLLAKLAAAHRAGLPIDGHAPGLGGPDLAAYVAAGITTDHECVELEEARAKLALGMKILIREGSAAKNFDALWPLLVESPEWCMLCSDDKHPNDLIHGHIDALVRRALANGAELFDVWRAASVHPVDHYSLDVGLLRAGDSADFIEIDSLDEPRVRRVWIDGELVAQEGVSFVAHRKTVPVNRFTTSLKKAKDFSIPAEGQRARVIEALDGQLVTGERVVTVETCDGIVMTNVESDILKLALVDRYGNTPPSVALVANFGLKQGAIASSVSHDSHNVIAVGVTDDELARAVNGVIEAGGGLAIANGSVLNMLPLPLAGLMSDADGYHVAAEYHRFDRSAKELGSPLTAPFMTLSFMALLVIPALKLGPMGLFDVVAFQPVSLWVPN